MATSLKSVKSLVTFVEKYGLKPVNEALNINIDTSLSNEEKAVSSQFETLAPRFSEEPQALVSFNDSLRNKSFVAGNQLTNSDFIVFSHVFPLAKKWQTVEELGKYRHILRWADLMQQKWLPVKDEEKIKIDFDAAIPREVKEKKKKVDPAAAAAAEAPAAQKDKKATSNEAKKGGKKEMTEEEKKASAEAAKAKKAAKAQAKAEANAKAAAAAVPPNPSMIDFRVGFIQKAVKHPDADSLYVSTIDMGDAEGPRTVCSGLVKYVPLEDMQERYIVTIANLKPVSMRGIKSTAMVLCASNEEKVEFVNPPPGSKAGDKLFFEGYDGTPEKQLNPKKKIWEAVQPGFSTNEKFEVTFSEEGKEPVRLVNKNGDVCKNTSIVKAQVR